MQLRVLFLASFAKYHFRSCPIWKVPAATTSSEPHHFKFCTQSKPLFSNFVRDKVLPVEFQSSGMSASSSSGDGNGSGADSQGTTVNGFEMPISANGGSSVADVGLMPTKGLADSGSASSDLLTREISQTTAAIKVQKVYRSYRTRRRLADSAIIAEEFWWRAMDFARLNHSTISFFDFPETAASRWNRVSLNASRVGKGLSTDPEAQKLAFQHWVEAIDPRHRYGHDLHVYYDFWCTSDSNQPFFYWLDIGDGKGCDLETCPRSRLQEHCIKYLGPQEREEYEYIIKEGRIIHKKTERVLDTNEGLRAKWIFVMSTTKQLYAGEKKKGKFHHSSFLAGGATLAAGRLEAEHGVLKSISAYSGHYRPNDDSMEVFLSFLEAQGIKLDDVQIRKGCDDSDYYDRTANGNCTNGNVSNDADVSEILIAEHVHNLPSSESVEEPNPGVTSFCQSALHSLIDQHVPETAIVKRINFQKIANSYDQLGHPLSLNWSTGAGPRIGFIADCPLQLRRQALEFVELSSRFPPLSSLYGHAAALIPPTMHPSSFCNSSDGTYE